MKLEKNEYVLAWRSEYAGGGKTVRQGVYGVVDKNLWPIIMAVRADGMEDQFGAYGTSPKAGSKWRGKRVLRQIVKGF